MTDDLAGNHADWPPELTVFPISSIDLRVVDGPHPFHIAAEKPALENWKRETAANPALFNGQMVLHREIRIEPGSLNATAHMAPFATFLWWRKSRDPRAFHLHGWPVIVSGDGALIAIRMSRTTANPGKIYFAAGSLDALDVIDGRCDLDGNMIREVQEETGLDLRHAESEPGYFAVHKASVVCLFRLYRFSQTADQLIAAIRDHVRHEADPEIDDVVAIRSADPGAYNYADLMPPVLQWFFRGSN